MWELIARVDEVLYQEWDPIGVNGDPDTWDEYSSYAPGLLRYAMGGDPDVVADQLAKIAKEFMGLSRGDRNHDVETAQKLVDIASQACSPDM